MIYTVTLNPSIDYVVNMDQLTEGVVNRVSTEHFYAGGKGINVSQILNQHEIDNVALGFISGFTGDFIKGSLQEKGIKTDFIQLKEGYSRINMKVKTLSDETEINGSGPKISKEEKEKVVENIFKGRISDDVTGFLVLILKKDRQAMFCDILRYFIDRVKEYKKIGVAFVTTAVPLSETMKKSVVDKLTATTEYEQFEMNYSVDKNIIGGMIIRIGDRVVDSSIRSKIESLAKELYDVRLTTM